MAEAAASTWSCLGKAMWPLLLHAFLLEDVELLVVERWVAAQGQIPSLSTNHGSSSTTPLTPHAPQAGP